MKIQIHHARPTVAMLEAELSRMAYQSRCRAIAGRILSLFLFFTATVILCVTLWFPVLQVCGNSMSPTLRTGDILLCVKTGDLAPGEIAAFYHNNKILVKRVIGSGGDRIGFTETGEVIRNDVLLQEPYILSPSPGAPDIPLPCRVPTDSYFVLGDHRVLSLDSRSSTIGFVPRERMLGKVVLRVWPLHRFGKVCQIPRNPLSEDDKTHRLM